MESQPLSNDIINVNEHNINHKSSEEFQEVPIVHEIEMNEIQPQVPVSTKPFSYINQFDNLLIMFVNPISGNQEGKIFLSIASKYVNEEGYKIIDYSKLQTIKKQPFNEPIVAVLFNLIDKTEHKEAVELIRSLTNSTQSEEGKILKVLIAGGDGTTLSIIEGLDKQGIKLQKCIFSHIPLGTGNDFSNALGFGKCIDIDDNIDSLYAVLERYYKANKGKVDVWHLELNCDNEKGEIIECKGKEKVPKKDENGNILRVYQRSFINYMSLGYDARVGFNFDKNRSSSRFCNKCTYFWEGLKKNFCRKTQPVSSFLESFSVLEDLNETVNEQTFLSNTKTLDNQPESDPQNMKENVKVKFCFKSKNALTELEKKDKCLVLKGEPASIICQNINLYMAGVENIWKNSKDSLAIEVMNPKKEKEKEYKDKLTKMARSEQKLDDHQLEFFTYSNGLTTGLETMISGLANKLYHGRGPVLMKFTNTFELNNDDKYHRIYLNVDGEYFNIVKPVTLRIQLNRNLCGGSLPFLMNRKINK